MSSQCESLCYTNGIGRKRQTNLGLPLELRRVPEPIRMNLQISRASLSLQSRAHKDFRKPQRPPPFNLNQTILLDQIRHFRPLGVPLLHLLFQVINLPANLIHAEDFGALETQGPDERRIWVLEPGHVFFPNDLTGGNEVEAEEGVLLLIGLGHVFQGRDVEGDGLAVDW